MADDQKPIGLVLIGKLGSGKSTLTCAILPTAKAEVSPDYGGGGITKGVQKYEGSSPILNSNCIVYDTEGTFGALKEIETLVPELSAAFKTMSLTCVLLVISGPAITRLSRDETDLFKIGAGLVGKHHADRCIICITQTDNMKPERVIELKAEIAKLVNLLAEKDQSFEKLVLPISIGFGDYSELVSAVAKQKTEHKDEVIFTPIPDDWTTDSHKVEKEMNVFKEFADTILHILFGLLNATLHLPGIKQLLQNWSGSKMPSFLEVQMEFGKAIADWLYSKR